MASTLRMPPVATPSDYPVLSVSDPPVYGQLNPRPTQSEIQMSGSGISDRGPLFGEHHTAEADSSLFQPNIAPDVVTIVTRVPNEYFPDGVTRLFIPQGTPLLLSQLGDGVTRTADGSGGAGRAG